MMEHWNSGFWGIDGMGYWENQVNPVILSNKYLSSYKIFKISIGEKGCPIPWLLERSGVMRGKAK